ncbi:uncharacterized protein LOC135823387 [Sycon ciliatum]|uniref:uncharacterized protein LOC135823387 n=1 Tax=Sycon ciliatum TaxID=27933 RepID=UPI0020AAED28|eukprot:scpid100370/ scgid11751/ 
MNPKMSCIAIMALAVVAVLVKTTQGAVIHALPVFVGPMGVPTWDPELQTKPVLDANSVSRDSALFALSAPKYPSSVPILYYKLFCTSSAPGHPIVSVNVKTQAGDDSVAFASVKGLTANTDYECRYSAVNEYGASKPSFPTEFKTLA